MPNTREIKIYTVPPQGFHSLEEFEEFMEEIKAEAIEADLIGLLIEENV